MKLISIFLSLFIQQNLYSFEINSGINKIQLIELYTSESCSSCPPAEKWINKFESSDKLWKNYVPVEFHVDYWNHLHWVDKYSKKLYSKRQRKYNSRQNKGNFTPQILLNGINYKGWRFFNYNLDKVTEVGNLTVKYAQQVAVYSFTPLGKFKKLSCFAAFLGGQFKTKITAGENSGRLLKHEFTVLTFKSVPMRKIKNIYRCKLPIQNESTIKPKKKALAFWIGDDSSLRVIQSIGKYLN
ncbi:MAG: DUF1223 domain-containing protein [Bacteriovoracaceae bacterium]|jgi:hypothetical protein|nr:DUF1223 domain-containing protein [Bacteriovoracaceae bacterium]